MNTKAGRHGRRPFLTAFITGVSSAIAGWTFGRANLASAGEVSATPVSFRRLCISTSDIDRSVRFYVEAFGFKADGPSGRLEGPRMANIMELPNVDATYCLLDTGSVPLELYGYAIPKVVGDGKRKPMNTLGLCLLSLAVKDMNATLAAVRKSGGVVLDEARLGPLEQPLAIMVLDPDGTRIELVKA